jgi:hypothetical protein
MADGNSRNVFYLCSWVWAAETRIAIDAELDHRHTFEPANTETGHDFGQ